MMAESRPALAMAMIPPSLGIFRPDTRNGLRRAFQELDVRRHVAVDFKESTL
jgi:hypothetical protein